MAKPNQNEIPKKRGGNLRNSRTTHPEQQLRRERALKRQAEYNKLTVEERIARLDARLGPGVGAKKERAKLAAALKAGMKPASPEVVDQVFGNNTKQKSKKQTNKKGN